MRIEIMDGETVLKTITASKDFAEQHYPGAWRLAEEQTPPPVEDPRIWWVDVGPFKDRIGMDIGAIAASQHSACLGVKEFLNGRKYVNLRDPKVSLLLDVMIANNQPAADPVWPGSGPISATKKAVILDTPTTEEERHVKGLEG